MDKIIVDKLAMTIIIHKLPNTIFIYNRASKVVRMEIKFSKSESVETENFISIWAVT